MPTPFLKHNASKKYKLYAVDMIKSFKKSAVKQMQFIYISFLLIFEELQTLITKQAGKLQTIKS